MPGPRAVHPDSQAFVLLCFLSGPLRFMGTPVFRALCDLLENSIPRFPEGLMLMGGIKAFLLGLLLQWLFDCPAT